MMRVRLAIPEEQWREVGGKGASVPKVHGEHFAYDGQAGEVVATAGNGGVWVRFDGQPVSAYVGVPLKYLERE